MYRSLVIVAAGVLLLWHASSCSALSVEEQRAVDRITAGLKNAGELYKQQDYKRCALMIGGAQRMIERLIDPDADEDGGSSFSRGDDGYGERSEGRGVGRSSGQDDLDSELIEKLRPMHRMVVKAHSLLEGKNVELPELKPFPGEVEEPVDPEVARLNAIALHIRRGGESFKAEDFAASATEISAAQTQLQQLGEMPAGPNFERAKKYYSMIAKAHSLLKGKNVDLPELAPPPTERIDPAVAQLNAVRVQLAKASVLFLAGNFQGSAAEIDAAQDAFGQIGPLQPGPLLEQAKVVYAAIESGHAMLEGKDVSLRSLRPFSPSGNTRAASNDGYGREYGRDGYGSDGYGRGDYGRESSRPASLSRNVSFSRDVAPIIVRRCGNCHVRDNKGELSMASYSAMMRGGPSGPPIQAGRADSSLMLELIVKGDMPPRGELPASDLETIRTWIAQGAQFDGRSSDVNLNDVIAEAQRGNPASSRDYGYGEDRPSSDEAQRANQRRSRDYGYE